MVQTLLDKIYMLDSINLQMTLGQSKYGFRRISFIIKMVDYYTTHTDFRTTHVRCPRARFAGCSFQTHIRLAGFTVYSRSDVDSTDLKLTSRITVRPDEGFDSLLLNQ